MVTLNLSKRLFWIIAALVTCANFLLISSLYSHAQSLALVRAYSKSKTLNDYFLAMRYVYHQQFLESGVDLNDSTVGFLPAHAATHISEEFEKRSAQNISIRNVSDRPRNPINQADVFEQKAIDYFTKNPDQNESIEEITEQNETYYFYASALRIEPYCLSCHGSKKDVLPYISDRYSLAYDYRVGDVKGITSIKIPKDFLFDEVFELFWKETMYSSLVVVFLLFIMYGAIHKLTQRDVAQKKELEVLVQKRTETVEQKSLELERAYLKQQHLYSVLRTVADSNQVLVTTKTLTELLHHIALSLFSNTTFAHVKISLVENGFLHVKESFGFEETREINEIEKIVFEQGRHLIVSPSSPELSKVHHEMMVHYHVSEAYIAVLKSNKLTASSLGTMSIYTTIPDGFSEEERSMLEELTGDIGFAINSFLQKESILQLSHYDSLTNLANKVLLTEQLKLSIHLQQRTHEFGALLFMDLDDFKSINDLKGHSIGDQLLVLMSERLNHYRKEHDMVSRLGGDEFVLLLPNFGKSLEETAKRAEEVAMQILSATREPFVINEDTFYITVSIGIALFGEDENPDSILSHADSAMYMAKMNGRNTICFFDPTIQQVMEEKSSLLQQLRDAIDSHGFVLHYQPQVDSSSKIIGVEALVRFQTLENELISPARFIPLCESSGLIIPLGKWVLYEAMRQLMKWKEDFVKSQWRISVNVSSKQFECDDFISMLKEALQAIPIDPHLLRLELTESVLIGDNDKALSKISEIKALGLSLSIDDFGTGYSNLHYLKRFNVDELKIDQSFVRDFLKSKNDTIIVETIVSIGNTFNMEVIAEGVETQEQFEMLKEIGCRYFQGYFFMKPTPPERL